MTSICSFIACISARMSGGVVSMREGVLKFPRSGLLGALLPSNLSGPLRSELSPWFPPGCCVLRPSVAVAPPDHSFVL